MFELIQYAPSTTQVHTRPLVVVPPQINKYYITDLAPGRSLVEATVAAGIPYFTLSWRNPTSEQRDWNLDTYAAACREAIEVACDITGSDDANVAGMCAGGITLAALLGHLAATGESSLVHSATFCVAGLDSTTESTVSSLTSRRAIEAARARSRRAGILSGDDMAKVFAWLRPNDLVWNYWVNNYLMGENPPAFDILYWNNDTTRLPAGLHSDFLDLYLTNGLVEGTLDVLGTTVDLGKVTCDTFVVAGHTDHLIPWDAAYRTTQVMGGDSTFVLSNGGHIQAILNPPDNPKAAYLVSETLPPTAEEWREARHPGRWILVDGLARVARRSLGREGPRSQTPGQRRPPAAGRCPRPLRPPVMTRPARPSSASTATSCESRCEARAPRSCSSWGSAATSRCGRRSSGSSTRTGIRPSPTTPPAPATRRRGSCRSARAGSPGRRRTSSTRSACQRSMSSVSPSAAAWPKSSPSATRTGSAGSSSPRRCAGSAASRAPRWRSPCWPHHCATTHHGSCAPPPAGCTDRSTTATAPSCATRSSPAGRVPRRCGATSASCTP